MVSATSLRKVVTVLGVGTRLTCICRCCRSSVNPCVVTSWPKGVSGMWNAEFASCPSVLRIEKFTLHPVCPLTGGKQGGNPEKDCLAKTIRTQIHRLRIIIIIIGIQPLGRSGQRPEFSQGTGMALVRCILGKFLGVACHCFPPLFRCSHFSPPGASTSATTWEIPSGGSGNCGRECCPVILPKWQLPFFNRFVFFLDFGD